jgi:hypothetical protein
MSESKELKSISIVDVLGKTIFVEPTLNQLNFQIDLSDFQNGLYVLIINETESYKISIQK